jgi:hypothetical protein
MARRMTAAQITTLSRLNAGWPESFIKLGEPPALQSACLTILSKHDCMDGPLVRCHRTVKTDTPAGSQTQSFRIHPDGTLERKL